MENKEDMENAHHRWRMRFDGGSRGNPGKGGAGAAVWRDNSLVWQGFVFLGQNGVTNNVAEYTGLLLGLHALQQHLQQMEGREVEEEGKGGCEDGDHSNHRVVIEGDSQLVVRQLQGRYQVKSEALQTLHRKAMEQLQWLRRTDRTDRTIDVTLAHIDRAHNRVADQLANRAMDTTTSSPWTLEEFL